MTTYQEDVIKFDNWITDNYDSLINYCKQYEIDEDILPQVYIKIRERISLMGFRDNFYKTYMLRAIVNTQINELKKKKNKYYFEIDNIDYKYAIENKMYENEMSELSSKNYQEEIMILSKKLFQYIKYKQYNDEWQFIFRTYFLNKKKYTYDKLYKITGVNKNKCTTIIQTIKKDLKNNFIEWLKNNERK